MKLTTYTTESAESLAGIAIRQLGDESKWTQIARLNSNQFPEMNAHDYYPFGTEIVISDEQDKEIKALKKQVAELTGKLEEKSNALIMTGSTLVKTSNELQELIANLAKRDLEQQAKGIEDAVNKLERPDAPLAPSFILNDDLLNEAKQLRNQAKEQSK